MKSSIIEWLNLLIQTIISILVAMLYILTYRYISNFVFAMDEGFFKFILNGYLMVFFFGSSPIVIYLIFNKLYLLKNKKHE